MIGLALVTFVTVFAQGLRAAFESAVNELFVGNYALTSSDTFTPLTIKADRAAPRQCARVEAYLRIRALGRPDLGGTHNLTAVDTNMSKVLRVTVEGRSTGRPGLARQRRRVRQRCLP